MQGRGTNEWSAQPRTGQQRLLRAMIGVVAASALVYPLLLCAVRLLFAQLLTPDAVATVLWLTLAVLCSVALVATVRWTAERRVGSPWLLVGLLLPAAFELWLLWPQLTA
jgi:hypothetical protein